MEGQTSVKQTIFTKQVGLLSLSVVAGTILGEGEKELKIRLIEPV